MKNNRVRIIFFGSLLITVVLGYLAVADNHALTNLRIMVILGAVILLFFMWIFLIASRFNFMDKYLKPLDKLYINHKVLGFTNLILIIIHKQMNVAHKVEGATATLTARSGFIALIVFALLLIVTIIGYTTVVKKKKGNYEAWKNIHRLMIIPYGIGVFHYFQSLLKATISFFHVWMLLVVGIGVIAALYSVFFYKILSFKVKGEVISVTKVGTNVSEITLDQKIDSKFKAGQFGFFSIRKKTIGKEVHPFTLTCGEGDHISFTPKNLGDYTKKLNEGITVGDKVIFNGPYGGFNYKEGHKQQLWIAGGVGVTPFVSFLRSGLDDLFSIDFHYTYAGSDNAVYDNVFSNEKSDHFTYKGNDSEIQGHLNFDNILEEYEKETELSIYYCGPSGMRGALEKSIKKIGLKNYELVFDNFEF